MPPRVLLVEDFKTIAETTSQLLEQSGFEVFLATNADEALEILEQMACIDIVFADIDLDHAVDGVELATRVAELYPSVRIVLTTGYTPPDREIRWRIIEKPYTVRQLAALFHDLLAGQYGTEDEGRPQRDSETNCSPQA